MVLNKLVILERPTRILNKVNMLVASSPQISMCCTFYVCTFLMCFFTNIIMSNFCYILCMRAGNIKHCSSKMMTSHYIVFRSWLSTNTRILNHISNLESMWLQRLRVTRCYLQRRMSTQIWFVWLVDEQFWWEKKSSGRDEYLEASQRDLGLGSIRREGNYTYECERFVRSHVPAVYSRSYLY